MDSSRLALNAMIMAVVAAGLTLIGISLFTWDTNEWALLGALAAITVASECLDFGPFKNSRMSVSVATVFGAGVFAGLPEAVLIAAVAAVTDAAAHRKQVRKAAYNLGTLVVSAGAFCGVLEAFAPAYDQGDWIATIGPAMVAATVAFGVNSGLVSLAIALDKGFAPVTVWSEHFRWMLPHYVFLGLLGVLFASSYDRWELVGVGLSVVPLAMVWLLMKEYTDRAGGTQTPAPAA